MSGCGCQSRDQKVWGSIPCSEYEYSVQVNVSFPAVSAYNNFHGSKKATIHQLTTMRSTSKIVLFPGANHLLTTGADDLTF